MKALLVNEHFARLGARIKVCPLVDADGRQGALVGVGVDERGEFFDVALNPAWDLRLDVELSEPRQRGLVLKVVDCVDGTVQQRWLCRVSAWGLNVQPLPDDASPNSLDDADRMARPCGVTLQRRLCAPMAEPDAADSVAGFFLSPITGRRAQDERIL